MFKSIIAIACAFVLVQSGNWKHSNDRCDDGFNRPVHKPAFRPPPINVGCQPIRPPRC